MDDKAKWSMENREGGKKESLMLIGNGLFGRVFLCVFQRGVSIPSYPMISGTFYSAVWQGHAEMEGGKI